MDRNQAGVHLAHVEGNNTNTNTKHTTQHTMTTQLSLTKTCKGHYAKTVGGTTITVSNPAYVTGEKSDWQLTIDEGGEELTVSEWFPTKREAYEFCVNWLMNTTEG